MTLNFLFVCEIYSYMCNFSGDLDELCKGIEVYQSCRSSPKPHKGDLKNVASEIMLKVMVSCLFDVIFVFVSLNSHD